MPKKAPVGAFLLDKAVSIACVELFIFWFF